VTTLTTRIFKNGNSQAVRIPQEFRLDVAQVEISRCPNGDLLLHPVSADHGAALLAVLQGFDDDFAERLLENTREQVPMQERESL